MYHLLKCFDFWWRELPLPPHEAADVSQVPFGYLLVFCRISDGRMRQTGGFWSLERQLPGAERRIYGGKALTEPLALALNLHYSPIIKPDELTLPDGTFPVNTAN